MFFLFQLFRYVAREVFQRFHFLHWKHRDCAAPLRNDEPVIRLSRREEDGSRGWNDITRKVGLSLIKIFHLTFRNVSRTFEFFLKIT